MAAAIWVLSWPIVTESFLNWLVGMTDTVLAAHLGVAVTDAVHRDNLDDSDDDFRFSAAVAAFDEAEGIPPELAGAALAGVALDKPLSEVRTALEAAENLAEEGVGVEVIDLATLKPCDTETVVASVARTGRCLVVHEAARTSGFGAEVAAWAAEELFEWLDAPVLRIAGSDTPATKHDRSPDDCAFADVTATLEKGLGAYFALAADHGFRFDANRVDESRTRAD